MGHYAMILKVWADDAEEAKDLATSALEESVEAENNTTGWDYVGDVEVITPEMLQKDFQVSSYKELEEKYTQERVEALAAMKANLKRTIKVSLAKRFLPRDEAPLYLQDDPEDIQGEFKSYIEKLLKSKKNIKTPKTFDEILNGVLDAIEDEIKKDGMFEYYLNQMHKIQKCINYPEDTYTTLQCSENHFATLNEDEKVEGQSVYYVYGDRHL